MPTEGVVRVALSALPAPAAETPWNELPAPVPLPPAVAVSPQELTFSEPATNGEHSIPGDQTRVRLVGTTRGVATTCSRVVAQSPAQRLFAALPAVRTGSSPVQIPVIVFGVVSVVAERGCGSGTRCASG